MKLNQATTSRQTQPPKFNKVTKAKKHTIKTKNCDEKRYTK